MISCLGKVSIHRFRLAVLMTFVSAGLLVSAFMPSAPRSSAQNNGALSCSANKTFLPVADGTETITLIASGGTAPYNLGAMSSAGVFEIIVSTSIARNYSFTISDSSLPTRKICSITIQVGGASPPPGGGGGGGGGGGVTPPGGLSCSIDQRNGASVKPNTRVTITALGGAPPYRYSVEISSQFGNSPQSPLSSNIDNPSKDGSTYTYFARDSHNSEAVCGSVKVSSFEPPGSSTFIVIVLEKTSRVPLKDATVSLNGNSKKTLADGTASFNIRLDSSQKVKVTPPSYCQATKASIFEDNGVLQSPYEVLIDCAPATPVVSIETDLAATDDIFEGEFIPVSIYRFAKDISQPLTVSLSIPTRKGYATPNLDYSLPKDFKKKGNTYTVIIPAKKGKVSYLLLSKIDTINERSEVAAFIIMISPNNSYKVLSGSDVIDTAIRDFGGSTLSHDIFTQPKNEINWTEDTIRYPQMPSQHLTQYEIDYMEQEQISHGYNCQIIGYANKSLDKPCQIRTTESMALMALDVARLLNPKGSTNLIMKVSRQGMIVGESNTLLVNTAGFDTCVIKLDKVDNDYTVMLYNVTQKKYEYAQVETDFQPNEDGGGLSFNYIADLLPTNKYLVYFIKGTTNINFPIGYSNAPLSPACIKSREELLQSPVMVSL